MQSIEVVSMSGYRWICHYRLTDGARLVAIERRGGR